MLLNLKTAIAKHKVSAAKISRIVGISEKAMSNKINEYTDFTRKEMYHIHRLFFKDEDFHELFKSDKSVED